MTDETEPDLDWEQFRDQRDHFAFEYVMCGNAIQAYKVAFGVDEIEPKHYSHAYRLTKSPKVEPRIEAYRQAITETRAYTILQAVDELDEAIGVAKKLGQPASMVSAIKAKIDLYGLEAPKRVEVGGEVNHTHALDVSKLSTDALAEIAGLIDDEPDS